MESKDYLRSQTERRWMELIEEVGRHRDLLADTFMQQVEGGRLFYESRVNAQELRATANSAFGLLLKELGGTAITEEDRDFPRRVGVRRARQGVESEKLTAAVHRDFSAIWSSLLSLSRPEDALILAVHAEDVWRVVDTFAGRIHTAYTEEVVAIAQERSMSVQSLVSQLLFDDHPSTTFIARAGQALSIAAGDGIWVAASVVAVDSALRQFTENQRRKGRVAYTHAMGGCTVAIWVAAANESRELLDIVNGWEHGADERELRQVHCGIAPLHRGLAHLHSAAAIACEVSMTMRPDHRGPATMSDVWPLIAGASLNERMPGFQASLLFGLEQCKDAERSTLLETVRVYAANGDVSTSAALLFCHRNTVMKRLRRFRELTGMDMTIPEQAAQAIVALAQKSFE
ncbi:PucR family transcriptional regulator [Rhodococcus sp. NPDC057529]|uniref:PucR family transcriptional regulator n=1 Tax=Rhodococcus sp. NPDC057529 TaxID=3346158 RepID=UPI0036713EFD